MLSTPSMYIAADARHKSREKQKARELRKSQWWQKKLSKGLCYHCGESFPAEVLTMDHLIPVGRGGHSDKNNVVVSCKSCNTKKGAQWPI